MVTQREKAERFRDLHEREGAFVIPNPWDAGSARLLEGMGFEALATTSAGLAMTFGRLDGDVTLDEKLAHIKAVSDATGIPVSADMEHGFADKADAAARNLVRGAEAGLVGASIEDYSREGEIYPFAEAVDRVAAAAEAVHALDLPFMLTARAEGLLRRAYDLDEAIRRLQAFSEVGADVLYAPALGSLDEVQKLTSAVDKPVNVLIAGLSGVTLDELAAAGAKRISVGAGLARYAAARVADAAQEMRDGGFTWFDNLLPGADMKRFFG